MSSFMMSNECLSILTDQINRDYINGNRIPYDLGNLIVGKNTTQIFNMLAEMNMQAVKKRYKAEPDVQINYQPDADIYKNSQYGEIHNWMYKFVKILGSYIYQCSEDDICECRLYKALKEYLDQWYVYLVVNTDEYQKA